MTQMTPAIAVLGPGKTGLAIGLRVLNLDGTTYAAFSATGVAETSVLGTYRKAGGVVCPDAGGYIVWGVSGTDYAEATVEPAWATQASVDDLPTNSELATALAAADDATLAAIAALNDVDAAAVATATAAAILVTPANKLVTAATGEASANVTLWAGGAVAGAPALEATAQAILEDTGTTLPAQIAGVGAGSSTGYYSDTVSNGVSPLDGVRVQLYTAPGRAGLAYETYTNALGVFEMWPDPGTYRVWFDLAGYSFPEDTLVEVTEP